jgi:hypothetical protein
VKLSPINLLISQLLLALQVWAFAVSFFRFGRPADVSEAKIFFPRSEEKANMNQLYLFHEP